MPGPDEIWDDETLRLDVEGWPEHYDGSLDHPRFNASTFAYCDGCGKYTNCWFDLRAFALGKKIDGATYCPSCLINVAKRLDELGLKPLAVVVVA